MSDNNSYIDMEVGKAWTATAIPPQEGVYFEMTQSGALLLLVFDNPTPKEIESAKTGTIQMGYYVRDSVLFVVIKIGSMPWMDAPFSIRRYDSLTTDLSDITTDKGLGIQISLIDRVSGILHSIRLIGASNRFTVGFCKEVSMQLKKPFNELLYTRTIQSVYSELSSKQLAERAVNMFKIRE